MNAINTHARKNPSALETEKKGKKIKEKREQGKGEEKTPSISIYTYYFLPGIRSRSDYVWKLTENGIGHMEGIKCIWRAEGRTQEGEEGRVALR